MMKYRKRRIRHDPGEINITAFMNLMVILVPFLLITAVFSRITVLELNLPPAAASTQPPKKELELEIIMRSDALEVGDRNSGLIKRIESKQGHYDLAALSQVLLQIKSQFPHKANAMILAQADTSYDSLVQVMDTVRVAQVPQGSTLVQTELFPDISIGDAPTGGARPSSNKR